MFTSTRGSYWKRYCLGLVAVLRCLGLWVLLTVTLHSGCSKKSKRLPIPSKREYVNRVRGCGANVMQAFEAKILRTLKGRTTGQSTARVLAQLKSPEGKARLRSLARRLMRRLIDRLRSVRSQAAFRTLITRGQLKPLRACFTAQSCQAFARCTVQHHPGERLQATEILHRLTTIGPPGRPPPRPSQPQTGPKPPTAPRLPRLTTVDLSHRDPKLDHRQALGAGKPPALWATHNRRLLLLAPGKDSVTEHARLDLSSFGTSPPRVHRGPHGTILVRTDRAILLLDRQYKLHRLWSPTKGRRVAAMTMWGHRVLVAAEGSLIVLNSRMQEQGRVHLGLRNKHKEAHHILVHENEALLLDNILVPILLFRVDLTDASRPRILQRIYERGVYAHLMHQWVDKKAKRWAALKRTSGRGGDGQSVLLMDAVKPSTPVQTKPRPSNRRSYVSRGFHSDPAVLARTSLYSRRRGRYTPPLDGKPAHWAPDTYRGHRLLCGISAPPHWAVFTREDQKKIYLGQLRVKGSSVVVERKVALTQRDCTSWTRRRGRAPECRRRRLPNKAAMDQRGRWVVVAIGRWLVWLKAGPGAKLRMVKQLQRRMGTPVAVTLAP